MKDIKLLFMDVDGTLTDGKIYIGNAGEEFKAFSVKDGYGINNILRRNNAVPVIITARSSQIVQLRCQELNISSVYQGCSDKKSKMIEVAAEFGITLDETGILRGTAYAGDDIPDMPCMKIAEFKGCPSDAAGEVKEIADYVSDNKGGEGAVRDFIEWLCEC